MTNYQRERVADVLMEIKPLLQAHYKEICSHPDICELKPDYAKYITLDRLGMLHVYTARREGKLIGYFISFVHPHLHYTDVTYAVNDILYLDPEYRGSTTAVMLFARAIKDLKDSCGARIVTVHMKVNHPFRRLLEKMGFSQTEEIWEKVI